MITKVIKAEGREVTVPDIIDSVELLSHDPDSDDHGGHTITLKIIRNNQTTDNFYAYIQMCGGEYSSQMGCYLDAEYAVNSELALTAGGDEEINPFSYKYEEEELYTDEVEKMDKFFNQLRSFCIHLAESLAESIDDEAKHENDGEEEWEHYGDMHHHQISATQSSSITIEKSESGRFKAYTDNSGFTQPNDYSSLPGFEIMWFENEGELENWLNWVNEEEESEYPKSPDFSYFSGSDYVEPVVEPE